MKIKLMNYIDRLIENCWKAKSATPVREFVMNDLSELAGIKQAIYVIEQVGGDNEKTFLDFCRFKQKKLRSCARPNAPSGVLYVGSSTTNLAKRVSEHLGRGNKATYALHLEHWCEDMYRIKIKVYEVGSEVLQIIEDALSDELKPAFGKQGGNNK